MGNRFNSLRKTFAATANSQVEKLDSRRHAASPRHARTNASCAISSARPLSRQYRQAIFTRGPCQRRTIPLNAATSPASTRVTSPRSASARSGEIDFWLAPGAVTLIAPFMRWDRSFGESVAFYAQNRQSPVSRSVAAPKLRAMMASDAGSTSPRHPPVVRGGRLYDRVRQRGRKASASPRPRVMARRPASFPSPGWFRWSCGRTACAICPTRAFPFANWNDGPARPRTSGAWSAGVTSP